MTFSDRIKLIRGELTQKEFASKLGVSLGSVQHWEIDNTPPNGSALIKIRDTLRIDLNWLLTGEGSPTATPAVPEATFRATPADHIADVTKMIRLHPEPAPKASVDDFKISDMVTKTIEVLESDTIYRTALASNINAFHHAIRFENEQRARDDRMAELEKRMDAQDRLNQELKQENETLKVEIGEMQKQLADRGSGLPNAVNHR